MQVFRAFHGKAEKFVDLFFEPGVFSQVLQGVPITALKSAGRVSSQARRFFINSIISAMEISFFFTPI